MIENIVDRAKKMAIKDFLTIGQKGIRVEHLLASCVDEFKENEDLPNTTNPDDWVSDLRQEGRADRRSRYAHQRQGRHRAGPVDPQRRQHRAVPVDA